MIARVCASYPGEFITITNQGPPVDIKGWRLSDGEGSVIFERSLVMMTHDQLTWVGNGSHFPRLYPDEHYLDQTSPGVMTKGNLRLADAGDQVSLVDPNGKVRDLVCYGDVEAEQPWNGPPAMLKKGKVLERAFFEDGRSEWRMGVPGRWSVRTPFFPVNATCLLHPEDALPALIGEIDRSGLSIRLACYIMENWTLARHLAAASARGVDVTVMLEGDPVGGVTANGAALAYYLQDSGVDVWLMRSSASFRRYDYLHAKYAVFDERRLFVSSENMADSSFNTNRGWAVLLEGDGISASALSVFNMDMAAREVDVFPLNTSWTRVDRGPVPPLVNIPQRPQAQPAFASLLCSPLGIEEGLTELLASAQRRILVQQMRIEEDWLVQGAVLSALRAAAQRGVSIRIQLDAGLGTEKENARVAKYLESEAAANGWDLQCRLAESLDGIGRLHNKGVIVDDTVMVGSANWVDGSMLNNREMMVMLRSAQAADTYAAWFHDDWKGDSRPPSIELRWHYLESVVGEPVLLDATGCFDASGVADVSWDLDGDGFADLSGPLHTVFLPVGVHNITLTVWDTCGNAVSCSITLRVVDGGRSTAPWLIYLPLPLLSFLILLRRTRRL